MSKIEWTNETWNCITGCTRVSPGCDKCYAATLSKRLAAMGQEKYQGIVGNGHFNGVVKTWDNELTKPLRWRKPKMIFVNSMSDTFHKDVPNEFIAEMFSTMYEAHWHTFQLLTKRPERLGLLINQRFTWAMATLLHARLQKEKAYVTTNDIERDINATWPLPNVWLGTSVEDQQRADERIPHLLRCPAAVRFISAEPLLGPLRLGRAIPVVGEIKMVSGEYAKLTGAKIGDPMRVLPMNGGVQWVIVGCESGPHRRPMELEWAVDIIDQCRAAGVAVFVKQICRDGRVEHDINKFPKELQVREFPHALQRR